REKLAVDAVAVIARDDVARPGCRPANGCAHDGGDAVAVIAQLGGARDVGADVVALDHVARPSTEVDAGGSGMVQVVRAVEKEEVDALVARDDVAGRSRRPADGSVQGDDAHPY